MKKSRFKILVSVYVIFWLLTWLAGPVLLKRQLVAEAQGKWTKSRERGASEMMAHPGGPSVDVRLLVCVSPFVFYAEESVSIGGLNGAGAIGWYVVTPWHVYSFVHGTWVS